MIGSRRLFLAPVTALTLAFGLLAGTASARDPAFIGGSSHQDPANLQSRGRPAAGSSQALPRNISELLADPRLQQSLPGAQTPARPSTSQSVSQLEQMVDALYQETSGSRRYGSDHTTQARYEQMMKKADALVGSNWNQLSPSSQELYRQLQALDAEQQRSRDALGDRQYDNPDLAFEQGKRQAEEGMRRLGDALMPVLQDMKRAMDIELRNAATRR